MLVGGYTRWVSWPGNDLCFKLNVKLLKSPKVKGKRINVALAVQQSALVDRFERWQRQAVSRSSDHMGGVKLDDLLDGLISRVGQQNRKSRVSVFDARGWFPTGGRQRIDLWLCCDNRCQHKGCEP